jgi:hypothetical protein
MRSGIYTLLARRLLSSNVSDHERQRLGALRLAVREFNLSLAHYTPRPLPGYLQVSQDFDLARVPIAPCDAWNTGCLC